MLRAVAEPVPDRLFGTPELDGLVARMAAALDRERDGVAIAAPQIGESVRLFLVRHDRTVPHEPGETPEPEVGVFVNPRIVRRSQRKVEMDEGCLSVRGIYGRTRRHDRATVRAQDASGRAFERGGGGLLAQIFQHEIDHLDGVLFIDHAEGLERHAPRAQEEGEDASHGEVA